MAAAAAAVRGGDIEVHIVADDEGALRCEIRGESHVLTRFSDEFRQAVIGSEVVKGGCGIQIYTKKYTQEEANERAGGDPTSRGANWSDVFKFLNEHKTIFRHRAITSDIPGGKENLDAFFFPIKNAEDNLEQLQPDPTPRTMPNVPILDNEGTILWGRPADRAPVVLAAAATAHAAASVAAPAHAAASVAAPARAMSDDDAEKVKRIKSAYHAEMERLGKEIAKADRKNEEIAKNLQQRFRDLIIQFKSEADFFPVRRFIPQGNDTLSLAMLSDPRHGGIGFLVGASGADPKIAEQETLLNKMQDCIDERNRRQAASALTGGSAVPASHSFAATYSAFSSSSSSSSICSSPSRSPGESPYESKYNGEERKGEESSFHSAGGAAAAATVHGSTASAVGVAGRRATTAAVEACVRANLSSLPEREVVLFLREHPLHPIAVIVKVIVAAAETRGENLREALIISKFKTGDFSSLSTLGINWDARNLSLGVDGQPSTLSAASVTDSVSSSHSHVGSASPVLFSGGVCMSSSSSASAIHAGAAAAAVPDSTASAAGQRAPTAADVEAYVQRLVLSLPSTGVMSYVNRNPALVTIIDRITCEAATCGVTLRELTVINEWRNNNFSSIHNPGLDWSGLELPDAAPAAAPAAAPKPF